MVNTADYDEILLDSIEGLIRHYDVGPTALHAVMTEDHAYTMWNCPPQPARLRSQPAYFHIEYAAAACIMQEQSWRLYGTITPGLIIHGFGDLFVCWVRLAQRPLEATS